MPTETPQPLCTAVTLEVIDVSEAGMPYSGVAADGVSELHFQACFPEGSTGRTITCENLDTHDTHECAQQVTCSDERGSPVSCGSLDGTSDTVVVAFRPSEAFDRPYLLELTAAVFSPVASARSAYGPWPSAQQTSQQAAVVRPPIILIHGIWASAASMTPIRAFLESTGQFAVVRTVEYGAAPNDIRRAVPLLRTRVEDALNHMNTIQVAKAGRVDIVAHSMGGLISRLYVQGYTDPYGQQVAGQGAKVRKLITLATPHLGSPVANWYVDIEEEVGGIRYAVNQAGDVAGAPGGSPTPAGAQIDREDVNAVLDAVRQAQGMSADMLVFGDAVVQMHDTTSDHPNPFLDQLDAWLPPVGSQHLQYYCMAGTRTFLSGGLLSAAQGDVSGWGAWLWYGEGFQRIAREFLDRVSTPGTDGVVAKDSAFRRCGSPNSVDFRADHFDIKCRPRAYQQVYQWLTDGATPTPKGTAAITHSPGHLHIYDAQGRHVGLGPTGQGELGIAEAIFEPYSDETGFHEFIWVPTVEGVEVRFVADQEGPFGLDISQGYADGLHWFSYEDIQVLPGSEINIELDPTAPSGQLKHPGGDTIALAPTYSEVPSYIGPTPTPEGVGPSPVGGCCGSLYSAAGLAVIGAVVCARRRPLARGLFMLLLLVGAALMLLGCLPTAMQVPEPTVAGLPTTEAVQSATQPTATPVQPTTQTALTADEIMKRSAEVVGRLTSARIAFAQESPASYTATGSGYVLMPDRAHLEMLSSIQEGSVETIIIGATGYWRSDPAGDWTLGPAAPFASNPASWIPLLQFYASPTRLADENIGGIDCYHLRFAVELPPGWCGLFNGGGTGEVWIAKGEYSVAQAAYELEYEGSREGGQMNLSFALSQFNDPVSIEAPE